MSTIDLGQLISFCSYNLSQNQWKIVQDTTHFKDTWYFLLSVLFSFNDVGTTRGLDNFLNIFSLVLTKVICTLTEINWKLIHSCNKLGKFFLGTAFWSSKLGLTKSLWFLLIFSKYSILELKNQAVRSHFWFEKKTKIQIEKRYEICHMPWLSKMSAVSCQNTRVELSVNNKGFKKNATESE